MKPGKLFLTGILLSMLAACAAPQKAVKPVKQEAPAVPAADLDCAEIVQNDPLLLSYPAGSIYQSSAVLPKVEGMACLDKLSAWLMRIPQKRWQVVVKGEPDTAFEPQALANKRLELLQRFFLRKGLETSGWEWLATIGQDGQLQLTGLP